MQAEPATVGQYRLGPRVDLLDGLPAYGARDPRTGRELVLTLLPPDAGPSLQVIAGALTAIRHPHLVQTLGLIEDGTAAVLVWERVEGQPLHRRLHQQGPLDLDTVLVMAEGVAGALEALHRLGMIHGGCEPATVLVCADGRAVLLPPLPRHLLGPAARPTSLAPEVERGEPLSPRSDVYGLAATVTTALCGRPVPPVEAPALLPALRPDLPAVLISTLIAALQPDATHRPPAPAALIAGLRASRPATSALPVPPVPDAGASVPSIRTITPAAPEGHRPAAWIAGALAGVAALALAGFLVARSVAGGRSPTAAISPVLAATATVSATHPPAPTPSPFAVGAPSGGGAAPARTPAPRVTPTPTRSVAPPQGAAPVPARTPPADGGGPAPPATAPSPGSMLLAEDFADPAHSALPLGPGESGRWSTAIEGGEFVLRTHDPAFEGLPSAYLAGEWADTALRIDVRLAGTGTGRIVVLGCRKTDRGSYRLTVDFDRSAVLLARWEAGSETMLGEGWVRVAALAPAGERNRIELACAGDTLSARVNGEVVATARDTRFASGRWWVGAGRFVDSPPATITAQFDTLRLTQR